MRLNDFGKAARLLRMEYDLSLKQQADAMLISSAHLSALEYGDKKLNESHVALAAKFFEGIGAKTLEISKLRQAGGRSMEAVSTKEMTGDARAMVFAFARKLQENGKPPQAVQDWLKDRN